MIIGQSRPRRAGFSLAEAVVAMALCAVALSVFYASLSQSVRLARSSRQTAVAAQVMERHVDALRGLTPWTEVTSTGSVATLLAAAAPLPPDLASAQETLTVTPYPPTGASF